MIGSYAVGFSSALGKVLFLLRGGVGRGILEIFCEKSRGPPTSQNGLMYDPSQIPTQKHLTLPPPPPRQK